MHFVLDEIIMGGMVLETNLEAIFSAVDGASTFGVILRSYVRLRVLICILAS